MKTLLAIPARYASTRYPGKPLVVLNGPDGAKSLIRRSWEAAMAVAGADRVVVATDDARIADHARGFGAEVAMTSTACRNGTERCAELAARLPGHDLVINLQGDTPLTPPWFVEAVIARMTADPEIPVATPVLRCTGRDLADLHAARASGIAGGTTAVFDRAGRALYFSKEVIPFTAPAVASGAPTPVFHHVGVYGYRAAALARYATWPPGVLEIEEGLEQLRFLENGWPVACVEVQARGRRFWELNTPADVPIIEAILADT